MIQRKTTIVTVTATNVASKVETVVIVEPYINEDGYIEYANIIHKPISNAEKGNLEKINAIILHRTDGYDLSSALKSANSGIAAHFYIDKNGDIYQIASLKKTTYHVGPIRPRIHNPNQTKFASTEDVEKIKH